MMFSTAGRCSGRKWTAVADVEFFSWLPLTRSCGAVRHRFRNVNREHVSWNSSCREDGFRVPEVLQARAERLRLVCLGVSGGHATFCPVIILRNDVVLDPPAMRCEHATPLFFLRVVLRVCSHCAAVNEICHVSGSNKYPLLSAHGYPILPSGSET